MRYVSLRGNLEAPWWSFYASIVLTISGLALIVLGVVAGGHASRFVVGGILMALGVSAAAIGGFRKRQGIRSTNIDPPGSALHS